MDALAPAELRARREALGLTQSALAGALGVTPNTVARWERGERAIGATALVQRALADLERGAGGAPSEAQHNPVRLPALTGRLIGRDRELADIRVLLLDPAVRILTLAGPGGTGKTRLAVEVAAHYEVDIGHDVVFVDLSPLAEPGRILQAIARGLAVRDTGQQALLEAVRGSLEQPLLLLLDNCEHLLSGMRSVAELVASCPALTVLTTSREPLHVQGERVYNVAPLAHVDPAQLPRLDEVAKTPAVALFVERAHAVQPTFQLTPDNAAAVAEVCARLDGLPLAIELAAARSSVLPVRAMATRLRKRLDLVRADAVDRPGRHQTLATTIGWSYDLLSPAEQAVFRQMSIFAGGATLDAAEAVAQAADTLETVASLVNKNLLSMVEQSDGEPRFRMLNTVRFCARDLLDRQGEAEAAMTRHAGVYLDLAERAEMQLRGPAQDRWLDKLERDQDNFHAALTWAFEHAAHDVGLRLAGALAAYWSVRGPFGDALIWLERALTAKPGGSPAARAKAVSGLGTMHWCLSDFPRACVWHQQAADLFAEVGDTTGQAFSIYNLGVQFFHLNDYLQARAHFEHAEELYRSADDAWGRATSVLAQGVLAFEQGEYANAARLCEACLGDFRRVGDLRSVGLALNNLGELARKQGDDRRAVAMLSQALHVARTLNDLPNAAMVLHNLGHVELRRGQPAAAAAHFHEALTTARRVREKRVVALSLAGLAGVAVAGERFAIAGQLLGSVESLLHQLRTEFEPVDRATYDATVTAMRRALGRERAASERAIGRTLALDDAVVLASTLLASSTNGGVHAREGRLSPREREVAALVADGLSNRQIAETLVISERTASVHVQHILDKLGFRSRAQIAAWVVRHAIVAADEAH